MAAVLRESEVHSDWLDTSHTPQITFRGSYLEGFGFEVGTPVRIEVTEGRIVITLVEEVSD